MPDTGAPRGASNEDQRVDNTFKGQCHNSSNSPSPDQSNAGHGAGNCDSTGIHGEATKETNPPSDERDEYSQHLNHRAIGIRSQPRAPPSPPSPSLTLPNARHQAADVSMRDSTAVPEETFDWLRNGHYHPVDDTRNEATHASSLGLARRDIKYRDTPTKQVWELDDLLPLFAFCHLTIACSCLLRAVWVVPTGALKAIPLLSCYSPTPLTPSPETTIFQTLKIPTTRLHLAPYLLHSNSAQRFLVHRSICRSSTRRSLRAIAHLQTCHPSRLATGRTQQWPLQTVHLSWCRRLLSSPPTLHPVLFKLDRLTYRCQDLRHIPSGPTWVGAAMSMTITGGNMDTLEGKRRKCQIHSL